jgi:hexulose-6-phosphate isomerase
MALLGFMQGRLSPPVGGRIQAFPWQHWRSEFSLASRHGFPLIEWTLDQERLDENPLMTAGGRREIQALAGDLGVQVRSLTGDCFMEAPFYKAMGRERGRRLDQVERVIEASAEIGVDYVVVPLVDNGRLESIGQEEDLRTGLARVAPLLKRTGIRILFESDFDPGRLRQFLEPSDPSLFGVNYDVGNSAAMGFDPAEEIRAYGDRILNVHVKDRVLGGSTVPLGQGHAQFGAVFGALKRIGYAGNYILQTARAADGRDVEVLCEYRDAVLRWLREAE